MSELLKSKKFQAACIGLIAIVLAFLGQKIGLVIPDEKLYAFLAVIGAYIFGQGFADLGKEKAKVEGEPPKFPVETEPKN